MSEHDGDVRIQNDLLSCTLLHQCAHVCCPHPQHFWRGEQRHDKWTGDLTHLQPTGIRVRRKRNSRDDARNQAVPHMPPMAITPRICIGASSSQKPRA